MIKNQQNQENPKRKLQYSSTIIQMARRLRLDLGKFGDFKQEFWSGPLPDFIVVLYEKRFGTRSLKSGQRNTIVVPR